MSFLHRSIVAALLLAVPVATQLLVPTLGDSYSGHLLFAGTQLLGWLILASVCHGLTPALPSRAGRVGRRLLVAGALLEVAFAATYGTLVVVGGDEGSAFIFFALGFLLLTVGGITAGIVAARHGRRGLGAALVVVVVLGLLATVVGDTWAHDVFLLAHYLGWIAVGRLVARVPTTDVTDAVGSPHAVGSA